MLRASVLEVLRSVARPLWYRLRLASPRRQIAKHRFRKANLGLPAGEILLGRGVRLRVCPAARAGYEHFACRSPEMVEEFGVFLREARQATCLVDIGACHGLFTLSFLAQDSSRKSVAVEPSPRALEVLRQQLALNGVSEVVVVPHALGRAQGTVPMVYEWHHLVTVGAKGHADEERPEVVEVEPLDDLCDRLALAPDLIKIDVEGSEYDVLVGGERTLIDHRPVLMLETHPRELDRLGSSVEDVVRFLDKRGYKAVNGRRQLCRPSTVVSRSRVSRSCWVPARPVSREQ